MTRKRRRWLTALGLFLATALGGAVAYWARRRARRRQVSPEEASVADLSTRLRQEAAHRVKSARSRRSWEWLRLRRRRALIELEEQPPLQEEESAAALLSSDKAEG